jgi:flavin reductase (DIM6/NTAB) family NADH-FMN oxidoreductase RutF
MDQGPFGGEHDHGGRLPGLPPAHCLLRITTAPTPARRSDSMAARSRQWARSAAGLQLFIGLLRYLPVADSGARAFFQLVKVDVVVPHGGERLHRYVHQPETDGSTPYRPGHTVFLPTRMDCHAGEVNLEAFHILASWIDYPMFIVTTAAGGKRAGCLVGFVTQASMKPSRMLVLISKVNFTFRVAKQADVLVVHFLSADDMDLARLFGEQTSDEVDKFQLCEWDEGPSGVPLLRYVNGWVAGRVLQRFDCGDHVAHLIDPIDSQTRPSGGQPQLSFQQVRDLNPGHPA